MSEWISVKERVPEDGVPVLITYLGYYDNRPYCDAIANIRNGDWGWYEAAGEDNDEVVRVTITHWMPLPSPPEEGTK